MSPAALKVPTLSAFTAWKTATWCDRAAPRDLWDLRAIARMHGISARAADLFRKHDPTDAPLLRTHYLVSNAGSMRLSPATASKPRSGDTIVSIPNS
ncbi:MAG: nucleotidyl transferase AbiEii/AbiGii toxin family protein [Mycobacteriales bacterium]